MSPADAMGLVRGAAAGRQPARDAHPRAARHRHPRAPQHAAPRHAAPRRRHELLRAPAAAPAARAE